MDKKVYNTIMNGYADNNIRFSDLRNLLLNSGFHERIKGDHFVYKHSDMIERIVLQPRGNKAKAYQVKQVRNLFIKYGL